MNRNKVIQNLLLLSLIFISGCHHIKEYHHFESIPSQGWAQNDTLTYPILDTDTLAINIDIDIRNRYSYKYENLILEVLHNLKDSLIITKDTVNLRLANEHGIWLGDGWGNLRQTSHHYLTIPTPHLSDSSFIMLIPLMPDSLLLGLEDIGIHITH